MMKFSPQPLCGSNLFKYSLLSFMILNAHAAYADEATLQNNENSPSQATTNKSNTAAVLPTLKIEAMSELDPIKSYVDYDQANVTRNGLKKKDIPQTIDTIDVQKYKIYGSNDLSVMLQGTPGASTNYDMRGDGIPSVVSLPTRVIFTVMVSVKVVKSVVVQPTLNGSKF